MSLSSHSVSQSATNPANGRFLLWVVLAALAVRLIVVSFVYSGFLAPGRDHWEFGYEAGKIARSIALGHGFGNPYYGGDTGPTAMIGPIFPYFFAGVLKVFGIYTPAAAIAMLSVNSLLSALTCLPVFFVANKSFGRRVARGAAWGWAFFPYAIYFSADSMYDHALKALLLTLLLLIALYLEDSTRLWAWAGFGALWGLAALVDPVFLGTLPFLAGWVCYRLHRKGRHWIAPVATAAIAVIIMITPWLVRNYRTFHHFVFLRDGFPQAFRVGNVGNTVHWWNGMADPSRSPEEMAEFRRVGEQAYVAEKWPQVISLIEQNPGTFAWRSVRRFVYLWTGYWSFNKEYLREEEFDPANIPFCTAFTIVALIGLRRAFRSAADVAIPFALLLLVYPLVYYITNPHLAYRQPLDPEVVILAAYAVSSWMLRPREANLDGETHNEAAHAPVSG
jgi:4-amino-4-deoxy-L-arabinose transferase-like glycosyltransferase